jgi:hypothetical protein
VNDTTEEITMDSDSRSWAGMPRVVPVVVMA